MMDSGEFKLQERFNLKSETVPLFLAPPGGSLEGLMCCVYLFACVCVCVCACLQLILHITGPFSALCFSAQ